MHARTLAPILAVLVLAAGCVTPEAAEAPAPDVLVTSYPIAFFASRIAQDNLTIASVLPSGADVHGWEPTPRDMARMEAARLLVYNGAGLEPWLERWIDRAPEADRARFVDTTRGAITIEADHAGEGDHGHAHGSLDPHLWLDPVRAQRMVENVLEGLVRIDPANEEAYRERAAALNATLQGLHERYELGLRKCETRHMIVSHEAYGYLADRYVLFQHGLAGLSPEGEPSPRRIVELRNLARHQNLSHVFEERGVAVAGIDALKRATGLDGLLLHPLETLLDEDRAEGHNYFTLMDHNLDQLRTGLKCL